jgi:hypothetical protein
MGAIIQRNPENKLAGFSILENLTGATAPSLVRFADAIAASSWQTASTKCARCAITPA